MVRTCSICSNPARLEIDKHLLNMPFSKESYRIISSQFDVSRQALERHRKAHVHEDVDVLGAMRSAKEQSLAEIKAAELEEIKANVSSGMVARLDNAVTFLDQLREVRRKAAELIDKAEVAADTKVYGSPANYLRELREVTRLLAELEGRLPQAQVNLTLNPEWIQLRTVILISLDQFPEAKTAIITAIDSHRAATTEVNDGNR